MEVRALEQRLTELEASHVRREAELRVLLARAGASTAEASRRHAAEMDAKNSQIRSVREEVRGALAHAHYTRCTHPRTHAHTHTRCTHAIFSTHIARGSDPVSVPSCTHPLNSLVGRQGSTRVVVHAHLLHNPYHEECAAGTFTTRFVHDEDSAARKLTTSSEPYEQIGLSQ